VTIPLNGIGTLNNNFRTRMEYFGTVRGRIGYAWDRTLVYATGGLAYADIESSAEFFGPAGQLQFAGNNRRTEAGYTVGAAIADERTSSDRQRGSLMPLNRCQSPSIRHPARMRLPTSGGRLHR